MIFFSRPEAKTKQDYNKPHSKPAEEFNQENERQDKLKKAFNISSPESRNRERSGNYYDDRFTRKDAYSSNDYGRENTFRSGKDFRSNKSLGNKLF